MRLEEMLSTDQEVYTYVREHLLKQNEKSFHYRGSCGYRGISKTTLGLTWQKLYNTEMPEIKSWPDICYIDGIDNLRLEAVGAVCNKDLSCAVGCLISDFYYTKDLENHSLDHPPVLEAVHNSIPEWEIDEKSIIMLKQLQFLHDNTGIGSWVEYLDTFEFDSEGNFKSCLNFIENEDN